MKIISQVSLFLHYCINRPKRIICHTLDADELLKCANGFFNYKLEIHHVD